MQKISELRLYFEKHLPGVSVETAHDFDRDAETFRFDKERKVAHLVKVPRENFDDYPVAKIIERLEKYNWTIALQRAGSNPMVFIAEKGFELLS